ncbi:EcoRII C terminal [Parelusimicrobium proximum]|uniref:type II restriction endonuclease n=1 Tax=Parelusimicrobium proximum TaxID=3228953 RepID=UPI003D180EC4
MSKDNNVSCGVLAKYFDEAVFKILAKVDTPEGSNQHEFNGVTALKKIFGEDKKEIPAMFYYLNEEGVRPIVSKGVLTWYDSREKSAERTGRSEYRLYYPSNEVTRLMEEGDLFIIGRKGEQYSIYVAPGDSTAEEELLWLFGAGRESAAAKFGVIEFGGEEKSAGANNNIFGRYILDTLGLESAYEKEEGVERLLNTFAGTMPKVKDLFDFTVEVMSGNLNTVDDPDGAVMQLYYKQEIFFKTLEKTLIERKLSEGFDKKDPVEDFIKFSLGVQNRRKSRAGKTLEYILMFIFDGNKINYSYNEITEKTSRPDFLFPSATAYKNKEFSDDSLFMLASKSSCKDRWRQVLAEAERIRNKHLFTLETGISLNQTEEMKSKNLTLVIPEERKSGFTDQQRNEILSLRDFICLMKEKQA